MFRQCLMKRSIEDGNLRQRSSERCARSDDALNVCRVVQGRELDAVFNTSQNFIRDQNRVRELFATVDHTMTNGMNVGNTTDLTHSRFLADGPTKNHLNGRTRIPDWFRESLRRFVFGREGYDAGATDAFNESMGQTLVSVLLDSLEIGRDQLKLDRRAAAVENQYVHQKR